MTDADKLNSYYPNSPQTETQPVATTREPTESEQRREERLAAAEQSAREKAKRDREQSERLTQLYPSHEAKRDRWERPLSEAEQDLLVQNYKEGDELYPSHRKKGW